MPPVLTPTQLTHQVRVHLCAIGSVVVEGEVTNFNPRVGVHDHWYFDIKDETSSVSCTWFRYARSTTEVPLRDGQTVRIYGSMAIYPPRSTYQLNVAKVEIVNTAGSLLQQYEDLKRRLAEEGIFSRPKRNLPACPIAVAVITSPTGAAVHDILSTFRRRGTAVEVTLYGCVVQGTDAGRRLANAINWLNRYESDVYDAVIIGRGGGSFEELFCFSDERLVRAIAASKVPVISAVGHQVDHPLSDEAADIRAPTPTAAAEMIDEAQALFRQRIDGCAPRVEVCMKRRLEAVSTRLNFAQKRLEQVRTLGVERLRRRFERYTQRASHLLESRMAQTHLRLQSAQRALAPQRILLPTLAQHRQRFDQLATRLATLNPANVLARGYSMTLVNGCPITNPQQAPKGTRLTTRLASGELISTVDN